MLKIKLRALLANAWSPHVIILLNFQMSVHLECGYPLRPFICLGFEDLLDKVSISPSKGYSGLISFRINWFDLLTV